MTSTNRLYRSRSDRMIAGVCGGLADYFGIDSTLIRLLFAVLFFVGVGSPILIYIVLWIVMREEPGVY
ncbi:MAG: PspC domain-containing protein [Caldilineaceae bacterium]|nr:PspC domain-containing protein [Caldilineaceae bacterium]